GCVTHKVRDRSNVTQEVRDALVNVTHHVRDTWVRVAQVTDASVLHKKSEISCWSVKIKDRMVMLSFTHEFRDTRGCVPHKFLDAALGVTHEAGDTSGCVTHEVRNVRGC
ncbi:hypothetical protein CPI04_08710, partial [Moraxella catarrhalis]|nr:hypothetical protein [Moraxella catarrhalis]